MDLSEKIQEVLNTNIVIKPLWDGLLKRKLCGFPISLLYYIILTSFVQLKLAILHLKPP